MANSQSLFGKSVPQVEQSPALQDEKGVQEAQSSALQKENLHVVESDTGILVQKKSSKKRKNPPDHLEEKESTGVPRKKISKKRKNSLDHQAEEKSIQLPLINLYTVLAKTYFNIYKHNPTALGETMTLAHFPGILPKIVLEYLGDDLNLDWQGNKKIPKFSVEQRNQFKLFGRNTLYFEAISMAKLVLNGEEKAVEIVLPKVTKILIF